MRLDFATPNIAYVEYERHFIHLECDGELAQTRALSVARLWGLRDGNVVIESSVTPSIHRVRVKSCGCDCGDECVCCPVDDRWYTVVAFYGFVDVPPEHQAAVRLHGEKNTTVRVPLIPPITLDE